MPLNLTPLVPIYQENIDALIDQLGKFVTLYFKPMVEEVEPEFHDPVRGRETRKPIYKAENPPEVTQETVTIKALLRYVPENSLDPDTKTMYHVGRIRLKTFLSDVPNLKRCDYIVPNPSIAPYIDGKYRLMAEPIPVGLQINRYAITIWERV